MHQSKPSSCATWWTKRRTTGTRAHIMPLQHCGATWSGIGHATNCPRLSRPPLQRHRRTQARTQQATVPKQVVMWKRSSPSKPPGQYAPYIWRCGFASSGSLTFVKSTGSLTRGVDLTYRWSTCCLGALELSGYVKISAS